jgi:hypothetical protein
VSVTDGEERLRLSDVGKLTRGVRRRAVGAARADDRPTFPKLLAAHLEVPLDDLEVVEESWPPYELVNVQTGLDAWLGSGDSADHLDAAPDELLDTRNAMTRVLLDGSRQR